VSKIKTPSGIESRWKARISSPLQTGPEIHPGSYAMDNAAFPVVKRPERAVDHPPHLTTNLKEE